MIIAITGTPGTGKSYLGKKLAEKLNFTHIDLNKIIKERKIYDKYDRKRDTYVVDIKKLRKFISKELKEYEYEKGNEIIENEFEKLVGRKIELKEFLKVISKIKLKRSKNINGLILDSHLSHYLPDLNYCIVVKRDLKKLSQEYKKRKYNKEKIKENLQAEIFEICLMEAMDLDNRIIVVENNS
jgi:adenylate kinase